MFVPYIISISFTCILKRLYICLGGVFSQGRLVTFIMPSPDRTPLRFNPRGLEPSFPSPWEWGFLQTESHILGSWW